ncbi:MAG: VOC family protein [Deltaproteobacteria bacterium]|nr:VOC family protein [Deltaproteobacteria bacterium]
MKLPTLPPEPQTSTPAFDGLAAVYLRTPDLDRSLQFWAGLLGLPILRSDGKPQRRYLLALGQSVLVLEESVEPPSGQSAIAQVALQVADLPALEDVRKRLLGGGVPVAGMEDHGYAVVLRFRDPVTGVFLQAFARQRPFAPEERFGDPELSEVATTLLGPKPS